MKPYLVQMALTAGLVVNEGINFILKHLIKEPRPPNGVHYITMTSFVTLNCHSVPQARIHTICLASMVCRRATLSSWATLLPTFPSSSSSSMCTCVCLGFVSVAESRGAFLPESVSCPFPWEKPSFSQSLLENRILVIHQTSILTYRVLLSTGAYDYLWKTVCSVGAILGALVCCASR